MRDKKMVTDQNLLQWVVGLVTVTAVGAFRWLKVRQDEHAKRMDQFEATAKEAAADRNKMLVSMEGILVEIKHLRKDHEQMKDEHKELSHQLAAHMQQEIRWTQGLSEDLAVLKNDMRAIKKRHGDIFE